MLRWCKDFLIIRYFLQIAKSCEGMDIKLPTKKLINQINWTRDFRLNQPHLSIFWLPGCFSSHWPLAVFTNCVWILPPFDYFLCLSWSHNIPWHDQQASSPTENNMAKICFIWVIWDSLPESLSGKLVLLHGLTHLCPQLSFISPTHCRKCSPCLI